jgi:hypothetical protein
MRRVVVEPKSRRFRRSQEGRLGSSVLGVAFTSTAFLLAARLAQRNRKKRAKPRSLGKEARMLASQAAMVVSEMTSLIGMEMGSGLLVCP